MARPVTVVTSNAHKYDEIRSVLAEFGLATRRRSAALTELQAESLEQVVRGKLRSAPASPGYVLVEDSGIFLSGLSGFPGVYSAYVYETIGLPGILRLLEGRNREAGFRTVAGVRLGRSTWFCTGELRGTISRRPRGRFGFGYDPIFIPRKEHSTLAERPSAEKNRISHRGRAFRKVGRLIAELERRRD